MNIKKLLLAILSFFLLWALIAPFISKPELEVVIDVDSVPVKPVIKPKPIVIEKPLHNIDLPKFGDIKDVATKKKAFFDYLKQDVYQQNKAILANRALIESMITDLSLEKGLTLSQEQQLLTLRKRYRINKKYSPMQACSELLAKVDIIPAPLVLVQAANESAWGTSRFARIGLNFFGIWCYQKGCGMVPSSRNSGANHEVEAFKSVDQAVARYLHNINTNPAYQVFRTIRSQLRAQGQPLSPEILATGLLPYSERGSDYVLEISAMIRHNQAYLFDEVVAE